MNFAKFLRTLFFYRTLPAAASLFRHLIFISFTLHRFLLECSPAYVIIINTIEFVTQRPTLLEKTAELTKSAVLWFFSLTTRFSYK